MLETKPKRIIFTAVAATLLLIVFLLASSTGILVIEAPQGDNEIKATLATPTTEKKFELKAGGKRILFIRPGAYSSEFSSGDMTTGYRISVRRFLIPQTVKLDFKNQKNSVDLGQSNRGCSADNQDSQTTIYYECGRPVESAPVAYDGRTTKEILYKTASELSSLPLYTSPYKGSLLSLVATPGSKEISFYAVGVSNGDYSLLGKASLPTVLDASSYTLETDTTRQDNPAVVLYDRRQQNFIVFDNASSADYRVIKSPRAKDVAQYNIKFKVVGDHIYLARGLLLDFETAEEKVEFNDFSDPQQYSVINIKTGGIESQLDLRDDFRLADIFASPSGQTVLRGRLGKGDVAFYSISNKKLEQLPTLNSPGESLVWGENESFYYLSGQRVFLYLPAKAASYLVYENKSVTISTLSQFNKNVYLGVFKGFASDLIHLRLVEADLSGTRSESILPIYSDTLHSIVSAKIYKDSLYIKALNADFYNNRNSPQASTFAAQPISEKTKTVILDYLRGLGIDIDKYKAQFTQ